jgi:hypothetical protein
VNRSGRYTYIPLTSYVKYQSCVTEFSRYLLKY